MSKHFVVAFSINAKCFDFDLLQLQCFVSAQFDITLYVIWAAAVPHERHCSHVSCSIHISGSGIFPAGLCLLWCTAVIYLQSCTTIDRQAGNHGAWERAIPVRHDGGRRQILQFLWGTVTVEWTHTKVDLPWNKTLWFGSANQNIQFRSPSGIFHFQWELKTFCDDC